MKQKIQKNPSEECPTLCLVCRKYYSGGSCLKSIKGTLLRMCGLCFLKPKEEIEKIIKIFKFKKNRNMRNPNILLDTPIVKSEIKRWIKEGYEYKYILEKLKFVHYIDISDDELNMFIETKIKWK